MLRYWLGLPEAEIAAGLGISPGTVNSTADAGHRRPGAPPGGVSMSRTEDRLTDALAAAARAVPQADTPPAHRPARPATPVPPGSPRSPRRWASSWSWAWRWPWAAEWAGPRRTSQPPAAGAPRYYVEDGLDTGQDPRPVVRSTATGAVTSTVTVPIVKHITGYVTDAVASARNGLFFVAAFVPGGGERVYQFRLTREGRVSGFSALPGGVLGRGQWEASTLAASPDGSRVAVSSPSQPNAPRQLHRHHRGGDRDTECLAGRRVTGVTRLPCQTCPGRRTAARLVYLGQSCCGPPLPPNSEVCAVRRPAPRRSAHSTRPRGAGR